MQAGAEGLSTEDSEKMQALKEKAAGDTRKIIEKQISLAKYGEDILKILANRI